MKVRELMIELSKMDADVDVLVVKQVDEQYQQIMGIEYLNEKHPIGGVTIHTRKLSEETNTPDRG